MAIPWEACANIPSWCNSFWVTSKLNKIGITPVDIDRFIQLCNEHEHNDLYMELTSSHSALLKTI